MLFDQKPYRAFSDRFSKEVLWVIKEPVSKLHETVCAKLEEVDEGPRGFLSWLDGLGLSFLAISSPYPSQKD